MLGHPEIAHCAERHLADAVSRSILHAGELAVLGLLAAPKDRPAVMLDRCLGGERIVAVPARCLAPPGKRARELPPRRDFLGVERACRKPLLVHSGLELL